MTTPDDGKAPGFPIVLQSSPATNNQTLRRLSRLLEMTLSIPERSARALSALAGGTSLLLANTLIPRAIRNTSSYRFTLGMFHSFMIRDAAGMEQFPTEVTLREAFLQRKALGTGLEAAGLLTMHFSPVWVFALASDTALGGQVFLNRLVQSLKEHGVIAADSDPGSIEQLLIAIQETSASGAAAIDMPPLSLEELRQLTAELRRSTANLANRSTALLPSFESLWQSIREVAHSEKISLEELLGILAINASKGRATAGALGRTGVSLVDEMLLDDYRETLRDIRASGALHYVQTTMQPFFASALAHFDFNRLTWTENWYRRLLQRLTKISRQN